MKFWALSPGLTALTALSVVVSDCGACRRGPPPILFPTFETSVESTIDASAEQDVVTADVPLVRTVAQPVPPPAMSITVDGLALPVPTGYNFAQYLALDLDADGDRDVIAAIAKANSPANLVAFRRNAADWSAIEVSGAQAPTPDCRPEGLVAYGNNAVSVWYNHCEPATPTPEAVTIASQVLGLTFDGTTFATKQRVTENGPKLSATELRPELQMYDRDQDGRIDAVLQLSVSNPALPNEAVTATVALLDRGTGFARDTTEPSASLARMVSSIRSLATNRRRANDALNRIELARRLYRVLCREAGAPRLQILGEMGMQCGNSFASLSEATGRAYLTTGELAAASAMLRADTAGDWGAVVSERFDTDLQRVTPSETGITARQGPLAGVPLDAMSIRQAALVFDPPAAPTHVRVLGPQSTRIELATLSAETPANGETADVLPHSPDGTQVVVGAFNTCTGVMLAKCAVSDAGCITAGLAGRTTPSSELQFVSDLPDISMMGRCARTPDLQTPLSRDPRLQWIGWSAEGLTVAWSGRVLRGVGSSRWFVPLAATASSSGWAQGASASSAGMVIAQPDAIFVRDSTGHFHAWRPPQLQGRYRQLGDLALSPDGRTLAARLSTTLWLVEKLTTP